MVKVQLVKLIDKSWFGDFNIILDSASSFQLEAYKSKGGLSSNSTEKENFPGYV